MLILESSVIKKIENKANVNRRAEHSCNGILCNNGNEQTTAMCYHKQDLPYVTLTERSWCRRTLTE